jgi:hypothetical protein
MGRGLGLDVSNHGPLCPVAFLIVSSALLRPGRSTF